MIFGGSIVNLFMNYRSSHPTVPTRPLIDYDAVLILEPLMLLGTTVGVVLNTVSPTWLIVLILVITIGYGAIRTSKRGLRQFRQERAARNRRISGTMKTVDSNMVEMIVVAKSDEGQHQMESKHDPTQTTDSIVVSTMMGLGALRKVRSDGVSEVELHWILANNAKAIMYTPTQSKWQNDVQATTDTIADDDHNATSTTENMDTKALIEQATHKKRRESIVERESSQGPRLAMVMSMLVLIVVLSLIRGGKAGAASVVGIETCSGGYWGVTVLLFVILIVLAVLVGRQLSAQHQSKMECKYHFVEGDIMWTGRNVYLYPALSAFAGMCGGLLGIGGGMIMGPLLLELGMLPGNTQATSATTVMITSGAAMFQFLFLGMLILDYGLAFAIVGFVATFVGQTFLDYLVKKYKTTSFIVFSIALVMVIAVILMAIAGVIRILGEIENGTGGGFTALC